jgi:hypothetical protein
MESNKVDVRQHRYPTTIGAMLNAAAVSWHHIWNSDIRNGE